MNAAEYLMFYIVLPALAGFVAATVVRRYRK